MSLEDVDNLETAELLLKELKTKTELVTQVVPSPIIDLKPTIDEFDQLNTAIIELPDAPLDVTNDQIDALDTKIAELNKKIKMFNFVEAMKKKFLHLVKSQL